MNDTPPARPPALPPVPAPSRSGTLALAAGAIGGFVLCIMLAAPFAGALTWALTLAILFAPLQRRLELALRNRSAAALLTVAIASIMVTAPAALVIERLVREAATSAAFIQSHLASGTLEVPPIVHWAMQQVDLKAMITRLTNLVSTMGASFLRGSLAQVIEIVLTFYILFFFLRDREAAQIALRGVLPLNPSQTEHMFTRTIDTVHATIYGTVMVSALQGILGGLMFWALGLNAPLLWGVVMGLLSLVPVLGAFIVWIPEAIFLALDGHEAKAIVLTLWGAFVVGTIDNVLRPILVGNRLRLHTVPSFISIIGGLILFGPPGFVLGPLIVSITLVLFEALRARTSNGGGF